MRDYRLLTTIGALQFMAVGASAPLMTLYLADLGVSYAQISLILTTYMIAALAANYASGHLSDRLQRRKPLLVAGLWLMAAAYLTLSRVTTGQAAWLVRILEGIGGGAYATLSLAMMGDLLASSPRRGREMGFYRGLGSLAFAVGAVVGGWLVSHTAIPTVFLFCAAGYLLAGGVALWVHEARPREQAAEEVPVGQATSPTPGAQPGRLAEPTPWGRRLPLPFLAGVYLWMLCMAAAATMWPNAMRVQGYSPQTVSNLWGFAALIEMPSMQVAGMLSDTIGRAPLLMAGSLGLVLVFAGYVLFFQWLLALVGIQAVRGMAFGSYTAASMTFAAEHASRRTRGGVSGLFTAVSSAGFLSGTLLSGFVVEIAGFNLLFVGCALVAVVSAGCFLLLWRQQTELGL